MVIICSFENKISLFTMRDEASQKADVFRGKLVGIDEPNTLLNLFFIFFFEVHGFICWALMAWNDPFLCDDSFGIMLMSNDWKNLFFGHLKILKTHAEKSLPGKYCHHSEKPPKRRSASHETPFTSPFVHICFDPCLSDFWFELENLIFSQNLNFSQNFRQLPLSFRE